jgi:histidinol-phosphate aminotransferase
VANIKSERKNLEEGLANMSCIEHVFPSDANFILARMDDAALRYRQLLDAGIVVRNRSGQPLCENTLRFTVGNPEENRKLTEALKSL